MRYDVHYVLKGMSIGFAIAAPVGPIGVLCIRRSLVQGFRIGFITGLGAATADAIYGCIAAFGLTAIARFLTGQQFWLGLIGGSFLCGLGIRIFTSKPATQEVEIQSRGWMTAYSSTLVLTLANPATILSFIAGFASFGLGTSPDFLAASTCALGVFIGSSLWWLILSAGITKIQSQFNFISLRIINRLSGCILCGFGFYIVFRSMFK